MEITLNPHPQKKVYLETLGCQSNVVESDHVAGLLIQEGYSLTPDSAQADVILFNTCSVRQHAEDKIFSRLGELTDWKNGKPGRVLGVLGCMATSHKENIIDRAPQVDLVLGPDQYPKAVGAIAKASQGAGPQVLADFDPAYFPANDPNRLSAPHRAFVEIMKGCDKFCTFCVVPFTRGREVSRPPEDILDEVTRIAQAGVKEVMLLGQNVNSYGLSSSPIQKSENGQLGKPSSRKKNNIETGLALSNERPVSFPDLLRQVGAVPGIERVRFMTSHPLDLSDDLVAAMAETPSVCEMIHLPVQCGSDTVLKRMNRKYTVAHYLNRVETLHKAIPELALTTDLIVGFPGETDEDFEGTLKLLDEVRYDLVYSFKYSPRLGTPAARMLHQVPEEVKDERLARLNEKAWKHAADRHLSRVGRVEEVMVEGPADKTPGAYYGKTRQNRTVVFPAKGLKAGDKVRVKVEKSKIASLYGQRVGVLLLIFALLVAPAMLMAQTTGATPIGAVADNSQSLFDKAKDYFNRKNYDQARDSFSKFVAEHPMDQMIPQAKLMLARMEQDFNKSTKQFTELAKQYSDKPEGEEAQRDLGARYYLADKYGDAAHTYEEFLKTHPDSPSAPEARYWYACSLYSLNKYPEAMAQFIKVADNASDSPWAPKALLGAGNTYVKLRLYPMAEKQYLKVLDRYPQFLEMNLVYYRLGRLYELETKIPQAHAAYATLATQFPRALETEDALQRMSAMERLNPELTPIVMMALPTPTELPEAVVPAAPASAGNTVMAENPTPAIQATGEEEAESDDTISAAAPFHIQVGVYSRTRFMAPTLKQLEKAGYKPKVLKVKTEDMAYPLYKIRVGDYPDHAAAQRASKELLKKTKLKNFIVED